MENFIGTALFILPGFMMYFWIQSFGINPVIKHTPIEFTTVSALLWIPVSVGTLLLHNVMYYVFKWTGEIYQVWNIGELLEAAQNPAFLLWFLMLSALVSYAFSSLWALYGMSRFREIINYIRRKNNLAEFSENTSVWDELFLKNEPQIVAIGKIDKPEHYLIGELGKVSRTFEPERISLNHVDYVTRIVTRRKVPVDKIFVDVKSGTYVKIFDSEEFKKAQNSVAYATFFPQNSDRA
ncbi:hypothetical protein J2Z32_003728 [Paenibacillus turicensis]|uniref:Uncharacterized protein n=1 Tax=Paenibacillus turicensis TaxID=160487 RepID=A0ABS4FXK1_9BACL|nr:hypothetical protein [Paenibacillus turicensis]MBP1907063.1 hypothetical protein [Paenibacillus turicensis]